MQLLAEMMIPFRVTTVVCAENVLHLDRQALLLASFPNCLGLGLDLLVNKGRAVEGTVKPAGQVELAQGIGTLVRAIHFINKTRQPRLHLRELEQVSELARLRVSEFATPQAGNRIPNSKKKPFCRAVKGESLAVTPDGRLFPCGQTMGAADFNLDTVSEPRHFIILSF